MIKPDAEDSGEMLRATQKDLAVRRGSAQRQGVRLGLACVTLPIIGTDKIVEILRSPEKKLFPNEWVCLVSEHQQSKEVSIYSTAVRGLYEEIGYKIFPDLIRESGKPINLSYLNPKDGNQLLWRAHLFVVPIRSLEELTPDGVEIIDIRARPIDEIFEEAKNKNSCYQKFKPKRFMTELYNHTKKVIDSYA